MGVALVVAAARASADEPKAGAPPPPAEASAARLAATVAALSDPALRGRFEPETRARAAAAVDRAMADAGLPPPPTRDGRVLEFPPHSGIAGGRHVLAWVEGEGGPAGEHVALVARFDQGGLDAASPSPGADAATGVAAAIEAARVIAAGPKPRRSVLVLALDLAEEGFAGPRRYVEGPAVPLERCAAVVAVDHVGRSFADAWPGVLFVAGAERSDGARRALASWSPPPEVRVRRLGLDLVPVDAPLTLAFEEKEVPSLLVTAGASRDDRRAGDVRDRIDAPALLARTKALVALVRAIAALPERPAWSAEVASTPEEARDLLEVVRSVEPLEAPRGVGEGARALRRALESSLQAIVERGAMTRGERASVRVLSAQAWESLRSAPR